MVLRVIFSTLGAVLCAACCGWLLARWLPAAALDITLIAALTIPLLMAGFYIWFKLAPNRRQLAGRLFISALLCAGGVAASIFIAGPPPTVTALDDDLAHSAGRTHAATMPGILLTQAGDPVHGR